MRVKEVMTIDPMCAEPDTPLPKIAAMMVEHHCGAIPILSDGRIAGIVTDRDITCRTLPHKINPLDGTAMDVMTCEVAARRGSSLPRTDAARSESEPQRVAPLLPLDSRRLRL